MGKHRIRALMAWIVMLLLANQVALAGEWDWATSAEYRQLTQPPAYTAAQHDVALKQSVRYLHSWSDGDDLLLLDGFYRWSDGDEARRHGDIQDLVWTHLGSGWESHVGIRTVFWGVTEFQHLVDIINQEDVAERFDGEARLGQPMLNVSMANAFSVLDLFILAGFRERTFPGATGWPAGPFPVSQTEADYESGAESQRVDFAARWGVTIDDWEVALSWFSGTGRDPELRRLSAAAEWIPYYPVIDQFGVELTYLQAAWLWKAELISRSGYRGGRYSAAVAGLEYTHEGVFNSGADLGWVLEYHFDDRAADTFAYQLLEHDVALGWRLALNDEHDSQALLGLMIDTELPEQIISLEGSRRFAEHWVGALEAWVFLADEPPTRAQILAGQWDGEAKLAPYSRNDLLQLTLTRYF